MNQPTTTVIFDLDGTLLDGDSTGRWLRDLLARSPLRFAAALAVAPVACTMILSPTQRRRGASMLLWIATAGMDAQALQASAHSFAARFHRGELPLRWRKQALARLEAHLSDGHRVAVVTAAPLVLARALLMPWASRLVVVGSSLKQTRGGWVADRHCRGDEKCAFLHELGYGRSWQFAYTDSDDDHPLLARAEAAYVVNPSARVRARLRARGLDAVQAVAW